MNVQIEKFKNRFSVKSKYSTEILQLIQSFERIYWNKEKLEWTLPIEAFDEFKSEILKISGIVINIIENKPTAFFSKNNDKVEIKFGQFVDQFNQFMSVDEVIYDKNEKKLICPEHKLNQVISLLKDRNIDYFFTDKMTETAASEIKTVDFPASKSPDVSEIKVPDESGITKKPIKRKLTPGRQKFSNTPYTK